jgi:threonine dehydratase
MERKENDMATQTLEQQTFTEGDAAIANIDHYRAVVDDHTRLDPLETEMPTLAHHLYRLGAGALYLLYTDDNEAGAFKWRGAFNKAAALKEAGVEEIVVPSAGNHARGAVLAARHFGLRANIVVPTTAPYAKKEGLHELWQSPDLRIFAQGSTFNQSLEYALKHPELGTLFHPYDDTEVIAGQGTIADDIERLAAERIDHVVMPVGGGGLLAGVMQRFHELNNTHTLFHAVEPQGSNSLSRSIEAEKPIAVEAPNQRYGGTAVQKIGQKTFAIIQRYQDRLTIHHTSDEEIAQEHTEYLGDRKDKDHENTPEFEGATLVAISGLTQVVALVHPGESIVVLGTGHNAPLDPR